MTTGDDRRKRLISSTALASPGHAFINTGPQGGNANAVAGANASQHQGQAQGQIQGQGQAQSVNNSNTYSHNEGASSAVAPSIGGGSCNVGIGLGSSVNSLSLSSGISWRNIPCVVQHEAQQLYDMGLRDAAITHLVVYHRRMGETLKRAGVVQTTQPTQAAVSTRSAAPEEENAFTTCRLERGEIRVGVRRGASDETKALAVKQCRAQLQ